MLPAAIKDFSCLRYPVWISAPLRAARKNLIKFRTHVLEFPCVMNRTRLAGRRPPWSGYSRRRPVAGFGFAKYNGVLAKGAGPSGA